MQIILTFGPANNATPSFEAAVEQAASMLDAAITNNITV
jgi:hypothetical protein